MIKAIIAIVLTFLFIGCGNYPVQDGTYVKKCQEVHLKGKRERRYKRDKYVYKTVLHCKVCNPYQCWWEER